MSVACKWCDFFVMGWLQMDSYWVVYLSCMSYTTFSATYYCFSTPSGFLKLLRTWCVTRANHCTHTTFWALRWHAWQSLFTLLAVRRTSCALKRTCGGVLALLRFWEPKLGFSFFSTILVPVVLFLVRYDLLSLLHVEPHLKFSLTLCERIFRCLIFHPVESRC